MIAIFCQGRHKTRNLMCPECQQLSDYASKKLDKCPFQEDKPTCAKCAIHCYKADMRQRVREVMRYSGPRMTWRHPIMAFYHLLDGRHKPKGDFKR